MIDRGMATRGQKAKTFLPQSKISNRQYF